MTYFYTETILSTNYIFYLTIFVKFVYKFYTVASHKCINLHQLFVIYYKIVSFNYFKYLGECVILGHSF